MVVVIAIMAVLGSMAASRFANSEAHFEVIERDSLLSLLRSAQLSAYSNPNVDVRVTQSPSGIVIEHRINEVVKTSRIIDGNDVSVSFGTLGDESSPDNCNNVVYPLVIAFDSRAEIVSTDSNGLPVCLNGAKSLCLDASGFAYQGACS